jgi:ureidoacrylate peracid hydrolase
MELSREGVILAEKKSLEIWRAGILSKVVLERTALVIVDLQVDFCSDQGALANLGSDVTPCRAVADRVTKFLPEVRGKLGMIAFFQLVYDPAKMSESQRERLLRDGKPVICSPEGAGIDLFLSPGRDDLVFQKHRYSAFTNSQFRQVLRERAIETVAVAGVDTHICVEGTVRHGYDLGYRMLVLSDLVGTRESERARHENSLAICERYFGFVVDSQALLGIPERSTESAKIDG